MRHHVSKFSMHLIGGIKNVCRVTLVIAVLLFICSSVSAQVWYSKSTGALNQLSSWGSNTNGTGSQPSNFGAGQTFNIRNNPSPTITAAWNPAGTVNVGDGSSACNFTIPAGFAYGGSAINVSANATLTITNATSPSLGTLNATSTVVYNAVGAQAVQPATYATLMLGGTGVKTTASVTVNRELRMEGDAGMSLSAAVSYGGTAGLEYNTAAAVTATDMEWPASFTCTGGVTIAGAGVVTMNNAKTMNSSVPLIINGGASLATDNMTLTLGGNFVNNGTFTAGSSSIVIANTATQSIGACVTTGTISCTKATGTATFTGNVTASGLRINGSGATLNLGAGLTHTISDRVNILQGTLNGGSSELQVAGGLYVDGTFVPATGTVNINSGTTNAAVEATSFYNLRVNGYCYTFLSMTISNELTVAAGSRLNLESGALLFSGTPAVSNSGYINTVNASASPIPAGYDWSPGTVSYNRTGAQTIQAGTYQGLSLAGQGAKTTSGNVYVNGELTVQGNASGAGSIIYGAAARLTYVNLSASRTINSVEWPATFNSTGGVRIWAAGDVVTLNENKTLGEGVPLSIETACILSTGGYSLTLGGNFSNVGALQAGASAIDITGTQASQGIAGFTTTGPITVSKTAGTATFNGNVSGGSLTVNGSGGTLHLGSARTHTFTGGLALTAGTLDGGSSTLKIAGNVTTGGVFTAGTGTVQYNGTTQSIGGLSYYNLAIATGGEKTLDGDASVSNVLSFTSGKLNTGAYTLTTPGAASSVTGAGANSYVNGTLLKTLTGSGTTLTYEVGTGSYYTPMTLTKNVAGGGGSIGVKATLGAHPNAATSGLVATKMVSTYWSVSNSATGIATVTVQAVRPVDGPSEDVTGYAAQQYSSGSWLAAPLAITGAGSPSYTVTINNGIASASLTGDYVFGATPVWYSKATGALNELSTWGENMDGSGASPTNFTTAATLYVITNASEHTIDAAWNPVGTIQVGDGAWSLNFTIPAAYACTGATINVMANAKLTISNTTVPVLGTLNSLSYVVYNAAGAQTLAPATYANLALGGTGVKTASDVTVNKELDIEGDGGMSVSGAISYGATALLKYNTTAALTVGAEWPSTFSATGGVTIAGAGAITMNNAKTMGLDAPLTINSSATMVTNSLSLTFGGNFNNNGTFTAGSSGITIANTGAQNIARCVTTGTITCTKTAGVATLVGDVTAAGLNIIGSGGTLNLGAGLTHTITDDLGITAGTLACGTSTVEFTGTGHGIAGATYYNLRIDGQSAATGVITVQHELTTRSSCTMQMGLYQLLFSGSPTVSNSGFISTNNTTGAPIPANIDWQPGTIIYSAGAAQTIQAGTYKNMTLSGAGVKTTSGSVTINGGLVISGGTSAGGTINYGPSAGVSFTTITAVRVANNVEWPDVFNSTGGVTITGTPVQLSGAKVLGEGVPLIINSGGGVQTQGYALTLGGSILALPLDAGTSAVTFNGSATHGVSGLTTTGSVTVTKTAGLLGLGGTLSCGSLAINAPGAIVNMTSSATHTITGDVAIAAGTFSAGAGATIKIGGNVSGGGTFNAGTSTIEYNGGSQSVGGFSYYNLVIGGTGVKTLAANASVTNTLTLNGVLNTGAYTLTVPGIAGRITGASATSYVNGMLYKTLTSSGTALTFEVGTANGYTPVQLTKNVAGGSGALGVKAIEGVHPNAGTSGLFPSSMVNAYWSVSNSATGIATVTPTMTYNASDFSGSNAGYKMQRYRGGGWLGTPLAAANSSSPYTSATTSGIAAASLAGDYIVGGTSDWYSKATGDLNLRSTWGSNTDGSGTQPTNFTTTGQIFNIRNNPAPTIGAAWSPAGTINLGDGVTACNFTIPALVSYNGDAINVADNATLTINDVDIPAIGILGTTSTVAYSANTIQTVQPTTYATLILGGTGIKTTAGVTVNRELRIEGDAAMTITNAVTYGAAAGLKYNTAAARTATDIEWPAAFSGTGGVTISGTGAITQNAAKTMSLNVPLTINSGATLITNSRSLTFGGNFINNGTFTAGSSAITITNTGAQSIAGCVTTGSVTCTKTAGVATLTSDLRAAALRTNAAGGTLDLGTGLTHVINDDVNVSAGTLNGGSSVLQIADDFFLSAGTFTAGTGTVDFKNGSLQSVPATTYYNLWISGTGVASVATGSITVTHELTVATGRQFSLADSRLLFSGSVSVANNGWIITNNTSTAPIPAGVNWGPGMMLYDGSGNQTLQDGIYQILGIGGSGIKTTSGQVYVNGTFSVQSSGRAAGTIIYGPSAQLMYTNLSSSLTTNTTEWPSTFNSTGGVVVDVSSWTVTLDGDKTLGTGVRCQVQNGSLNTGGYAMSLGGDLANTGTFIAGSSAISLTGSAAQSIAGFVTTGPVTMAKNAGTATLAGNTSCGSLIVNGSGGTLSLGAALTHTVTGDAALTQGIVNCLNSTLKIGGNLTTGGTFNANTGTVEYYGGNQAVGGLTYNNLTVSGGGIKTLGANATVSGVLSLNNGVVNTGAFSIMTRGASGGVTGGSAASYVNGVLYKTLSGSSTGLNYEVGTVNGYRPMIITKDAAGGGGSIGVSATAGAHPNLVASGLPIANTANLYWSVSNSATGIATVNVQATYDASDIPGDNSGYITQLYHGGAWLPMPLPTTNTSSPYTSATTGGIAAGQLSGDYIFGNCTVDLSNFTSPAATSPCLGNASTVTVNSATLSGSTTYSVAYTLSNAAGNTGTFTDGAMTYGTGSGTFTVPAGRLASAGATTITINTIQDPSSGCTVSATANNTAGFVVSLLPVADAGSTVAAICQGGTTAALGGAFSGSATVAVWNDGGAGGTFANNTGATPETATYRAADTAASPVTLMLVTSGGGCGSDTATKLLTVYQSPVIASIGSSTPICEGSALSLFTTVNGGGGGYNYSWRGPSEFSSTDEDPLVAAVADPGLNGTYTLSVTDANSCDAQGVGTTNVIVFPMQPITGNATVIFGQTISLSNPVAGGTWTTPMPWTTLVAPTTGNAKGISAGVAEVSYTTADGCVSTHTVTVLSGVNACVGQVITISDGTAGGTWASANASIATVTTTTGSVKGVSAGKAVIMHYIHGTQITTTVTVHPLAATTVSPASVCQGQSLTATNTTAGGGTWYSGNTATAVVSAGGIVTGLGGGSVVIYFTPVAGCVTTKTVTIVPTTPITGNMTVCVGQTTALTNASTGGAWSTSSGSLANVSSAGLVRGVSAGQPRVSYIWPTGCFSTATVVVNPLAPSTTLYADVVCERRSIAYANATVGGGVWSSSNTSLATITSAGSINGVSSGVAMISFTTPLGCVTTKSVTVRPSPVVWGAASVCAGQTIAMSNDLSGGTWSSSTAGIATVNTTLGIVKGLTSGSTRISYMLPTGCYEHATVSVNALSAITGGTSGMCQNSSMTLVNATPGGGAWSSSNTGVATVSSSGVVRGAGVGTVSISFTTGQSCVASRTVTVNACRESGDAAAVEDAATGLQELQLFPNPNKGTFVVKGNIDTDERNLVIDITDVLGQTVYKADIAVRDGIVEQQLTLPANLPGGSYLLSAAGAGGKKVFRFVVAQ